MVRWLKDICQRDLVTLREKREKRHGKQKVLCPKCGYDVKILPDRPCPECGLFVHSAWRGGWWGAGSDWRAVIPFMLGIVGFNAMLRPAALLYVGMLLTQDGTMTWMTPEVRVRYFAVGGVILSWGLVSLGMLIIAIMRRRWLVYGPRRYATRTVLVLLAAQFFCAFVAEFAIDAYAAYSATVIDQVKP